MNSDAATAFVSACALDVAVRKPGNVSIASPGHGMSARDFLASASAAAAPLFAAGAPVGARIEAAVRATRAAVGCNTNLGIVLLVAPLAAALERCASPCQPPQLRASLEAVLAALDVEDARAAFRAIALANPGGLGTAAEQDVREVPTVGLRAAMRLAAHRDRIAHQYSSGYEDVFAIGLPPFFRHEPRVAMLAAFLALLAAGPDSHIVRKQGPAVAHSVTAQARTWVDRWAADARPPDATALAEWDDRLKAAGINPGTSADLAVASAFVAAVTDPRIREDTFQSLARNVLAEESTLTRPSG